MKATKEEVMKIVCNYYAVPQEKLKSKDRQQPISKARHMYMYLSRLYTTASYSEIGSLVNRDHCTALYAFNKFNGYVSHEEEHELNFLSSILDNELIEANLHTQMFNQLGRFYRVTLAPDFAWGIAGLKEV